MRRKVYFGIDTPCPLVGRNCNFSGLLRPVRVILDNAVYGEWEGSPTRRNLEWGGGCTGQAIY